MAITINGTTGITDVNGTAAAPAITGTDTDSGMYFDTNIVALATGGTNVVYVNASQNVGIGTTSPITKLQIKTQTNGNAAFQNSTSVAGGVKLNCFNDAGSASAALELDGSTLQFNIAAVEKARIDSSGNLLVGTTTSGGAGGTTIYPLGNGAGSTAIQVFNKTNTTTDPAIQFRVAGTTVNAISYTNLLVTYGTTSDYRLKEDVQPMTGALEKVAQLKPVTYKWKIDGSNGEGFIAHELADVCPYAVAGEKDALDKDGNINPQGVDTSFLVATLTAAIQEQQALITSLTDRIAALEAR